MYPVAGWCQGPTEYEVKAAFLLKFTDYVEWPAAANDAKDFTIGVLGDDPFGSVLDQSVQGKSTGSRPLRVVRANDIKDLKGCQIVFIVVSEPERLSAVLADLNHDPVLTVGESDAFTRAGGMIRFFTEKNRVRFEVNLEAAEQAALRISSKLLKVARIYRDPNPARGD
jgi:hypothetical protein